MSSPFVIPPYQYILLDSDRQLAAEDNGESNSLSVEDYGRGRRQQLFSIFPDGRIRLFNGKFTAPNFYESQVILVEEGDAFKWTIIWHPDGYQNGNAWTFSEPHNPIEIVQTGVNGDRQKYRFVYGFPNGTPQPDDPTNTEEPIRAQAAEKILIRGAQGGIPLPPFEIPIRGGQIPPPFEPIPTRGGQGDIPGLTPPRLEIHDFVQNEKFFSLYVQALRELQSLPEDDVASYYQISGLHGFPLVRWNQSEVGNGIYCKHGQNIFPTWHRPYVALFEQIIQQHALAIAEQYRTDTDEWLEAAWNLRQPFWDWARPGGATPPDVILSRQTLRILTPKGYRNVENPFLYYRYKSERSTATFPSQFVEWTRTIRDPYNDNPDQDIRERAENAQAELTMKTHDLFEIDNWEEFSNKAQTQSGSTNSLEALHDSIHVLIGRNGHFAGPVAAFDALFYLHHSQVDRLLSLWHTLHDKWVPEPNLHEALAPFWRDGNSYWNSAEIRHHEVFNYTYPEYPRGPPGGPHLRQHIRDKVDELYGDPSKKIFKHLDLNRPVQSWSVRIRIKPFEIDQSFSLVVFLNEVPKDPHTWLKSKDLVGSYQVFVAYLPKDCENCRSREKQPIEGFVHITSALQEQIKRLSLKTEDVAEFLEENLHLGLQRVDGTLVDLTAIEFEAKVVSREISKPPSRNPTSKLVVGKAKELDFKIKPGALFFPK